MFNNDNLRFLLLQILVIGLSLLVILFMGVLSLRQSLGVIKEKQQEQQEQIEYFMHQYTQIKQIEELDK